MCVEQDIGVISNPRSPLHGPEISYIWTWMKKWEIHCDVLKITAIETISCWTHTLIKGRVLFLHTFHLKFVIEVYFTKNISRKEINWNHLAATTFEILASRNLWWQISANIFYSHVDIFSPCHVVGDEMVFCKTSTLVKTLIFTFLMIEIHASIFCFLTCRHNVAARIVITVSYSQSYFFINLKTLFNLKTTCFW